MVARTRGGFNLSDRFIKTKFNTIITTMDCVIEVPSRFLDIGLAYVGVTTKVFGVFAIIFEDGKYTVGNIPAFVDIVPDSFVEIEHDEIPYHQFRFKANEVVIQNKDVVRIDTMMFNLISEYIFKGKTPWYTEPMDLAKLFDFAEEVAASRIGNNLQTIEFIASMVVRDSKDRSVSMREVAKSLADFKRAAIVPLTSVFYGIRSPLNKVAGAYMQDGVISALVSPAESPGRVETILRA
jgi:hypothetical protein